MMNQHRRNSVGRHRLLGSRTWLFRLRISFFELRIGFRIMNWFSDCELVFELRIGFQIGNCFD